MTLRANQLHFDLQGHRGARGLAPENTLPGFALAMEIGVSTLEMDTAVTQDGVVVIAHDRRLNADITRDRHGNWLSPPTPAVSSLQLDQIREFDVGRINPACAYARRFPQQRGVDGIGMPTLAEVFALARSAGNSSLRFNIETKLSPLHPEEALQPQEFTQLLLECIRTAGMVERVTIQSFDWRTLRIAQIMEPAIAVSFLTTQSPPNPTIAPGWESPWTDTVQLSAHGSVPRMVAEAGTRLPPGGRPITWSPDFAGLTVELVAEAQALGLLVLPWTLNEPNEIGRAIAMGVDGLITDYPDRARAVMAQLGVRLPESVAPAGANRISRPHE